MTRSLSSVARAARRTVVSGALVALAAAPVSFLASQPAGAASYPTSHTLNLSFLQDPGQPPDPDVYYAGEGLLLTRNLYQGLLTYKSDTAKRILEPELAVLDETDSGLDVDALRTVARGVTTVREERPKLGVLVITHYLRMLEALTVDRVHLLVDGVVVANGGPELARSLESEGYEAWRS